MFDHDHLRDQIESTVAYLRRLDSSRAAINYRSLRTRLWIHILAEARAGTLTVDWRTTLYVAEPDNALRHEILGPAAAAILPASQDADSEALILHELVTMPPRPWEPYAAAGDWRAAINAWYADTLAIDEYRRQPLDPLLAEHMDSIGLGARISLRPDVEAMLRALREASYRAGLAAGGDNDFADWQEWLDAQMKALKSPQRDSGRADSEAVRQHLQQLPTYWTEQHP